MRVGCRVRKYGTVSDTVPGLASPQAIARAVNVGCWGASTLLRRCAPGGLGSTRGWRSYPSAPVAHLPTTASRAPGVSPGLATKN